MSVQHGYLHPIDFQLAAPLDPSQDDLTLQLHPLEVHCRTSGDGSNLPQTVLVQHGYVHPADFQLDAPLDLSQDGLTLQLHPPEVHCVCCAVTVVTANVSNHGNCPEHIPRA